MSHNDETEPNAKNERLIVREIDSETLVYDRGRGDAKCSSEFAAMVFLIAAR